MGQRSLGFLATVALALGYHPFVHAMPVPADMLGERVPNSRKESYPHHSISADMHRGFYSDYGAASRHTNLWHNGGHRDKSRGTAHSSRERL